MKVSDKYCAGCVWIIRHENRREGVCPFVKCVKRVGWSSAKE